MKNAATRKSLRSSRKKNKNPKGMAMNRIASPDRKSQDLEQQIEKHSLYEHHVLPGEEDPEISHTV
jgi:hypothetical protein